MWTHYHFKQDLIDQPKFIAPWYISALKPIMQVAYIALLFSSMHFGHTGLRLCSMTQGEVKNMHIVILGHNLQISYYRLSVGV